MCQRHSISAKEKKSLHLPQTATQLTQVDLGFLMQWKLQWKKLSKRRRRSGHRGVMDVSSHSLFLLQQLNIQREFGFLCDCTVAIGNVYFKAHRAVLAAFSNYFKMIFIHQSSECIKIQPTDIQPDVFSYLLHIMYTGMGPKQQVDQSRLQEGIKFLHAYQLYRNTGEGGQEAASDTIKISNLYGIQISSQMAAKENLGLKENRSRVLEEEMSGTQADRPQIQLSLAVGLEGTSSDRPLSSLHGPSSVTSRDEPEAPNISVTIKQEKTELELSAEPQTSSPQNPESQSPGLFKDSPKPLYCHYCGERCSSRRNLREHLYTHASGSLPFGVPAAILENNNLGEVQKISEDFESLEERHLQSFLVRKSPQSQDQPDSGSLEEALRQSQSLTLSSEELAAELKSGSPYSRKRKIACAICSLRFAQKSQLQEHMYTHTGKHSRYHRYNRFCSQLIQASQHYCESQSEYGVEESARDSQDNVSSCYSLDSEISQESIDTVVVE